MHVFSEARIMALTMSLLIVTISVKASVLDHLPCFLFGSSMKSVSSLIIGNSDPTVNTLWVASISVPGFVNEEAYATSTMRKLARVS